MKILIPGLPDDSEGGGRPAPSHKLLFLIIHLQSFVHIQGDADSSASLSTRGGEGLPFAYSSPLSLHLKINVKFTLGAND